MDSNSDNTNNNMAVAAGEDLSVINISDDDMSVVSDSSATIPLDPETLADIERRRSMAVEIIDSDDSMVE